MAALDFTRATPQIILEIAWLRRLARIADKEARDREPSPLGAPSPPRLSREEGHGGQSVRRTFGLRQLQLSPVPSRIEKAPAPAEPLWRKLPPFFEVEFSNISDARTAHRTTLERAKKNQPPSGKKLALRPVDPADRALADGLTCTASTPGFSELFAEIDRHGGNSRRFFVAGVTDSDGNPAAVRILLARPA